MTDRPSRRSNWRMPPLSTLERPVMSMQRKIGMLTLRGYLFFAFDAGHREGHQCGDR
jgi:hypothetical protein